MASALETLAAEALQLGLRVEWPEEGSTYRLVIWRDGPGDVLLQVQPTPLGLRYISYESDFGDVVPSHWCDTVVAGHRQGPLLHAYWWSYRKLWGWLTFRRWRGLTEALAWLDQATLIHEHQMKQLLAGQANG